MGRQTDPYLTGIYAPVADEITADDLDVIGDLPDDLAGVFCNNASNPRFEPKGRYHWFDGDGMIHGVHIADGRARYRNRYVRTPALAAEETAGEAIRSGIMEPPDLSHPDGPYKNTANTDLVWHAGKLLALWWLGGEPYAVDVRSLETIGAETFGGRLETGVAAHAKVDPVTGEMMFIDYQPMPPYLTYGVVGADGVLSHTEPIDLPGYRLQHDIAITPRHSMLMDMSMMWDPDALAEGKIVLGFFGDEPSRIGLIPRHGTNADVTWFECDPFFMYHTVNAWEDDDRVVLQGCRITRPIADMIGPDEKLPVIGRLAIEPFLHEWTFDLTTGAVKERQLDDRILEFPRINDGMIGRATRYSYNQLIPAGETLVFEGISKVDTADGSSVAHRYEPGWCGSEAAFCPRAGAVDEDDGYVLAFVQERASGASELRVLDAQRLDDPPVARIRIPQRVPMGFHARWIPEHEIA